MNKVKVWSRYLQYLRDWADSHSEPGFYGLAPACFDEWYGCEYQEEDKGNTDTDSPGSFEVTITETLRKIVTVEADNPDGAEQTASDNWRAGDYILDADNFVDVDFDAIPLST
jgi:hypothetical protein